MISRIKTTQSGFSLFIALSVGATLMAGCSNSTAPAAATPPPVPVTVAEVMVQKVPIAMEAVGQAEGAKQVEVRARVGGILVKRLYQEGAPVRAGQALFEIDRVPYLTALEQARGQMAAQKARADQGVREATRLRGLLKERAISQKEFDDAQSNQEAADASLSTAAANLRQAELNLSYATVVAPEGGMSGRAEYSEGALVMANGMLTSIVQANPMWVRFAIADKELAALRGAADKKASINKVEAILPDGSTYGHAGKLNFESAAIDPRYGTVGMRAEFDNPKDELLAGQFLRVRVISGEREAVLLPQTVVLQNDKGTFVFVMASDGTAQVRPVKTDGWSGTNWIVTSGVKPGDKVIIDNLVKLKPGAPVKVEPAKTTGDKPAAKS